MTKRAYYTNYADAIYMMEHYGVRCIVDAKEFIEDFPWETSICAVHAHTIKESIDLIKNVSPSKIYVHPSSMEVFKIKAGDNLLVSTGNTTICTKVTDEYFEIKSENYVHRVPHTEAFKFEIIRRGNKPFIWPEFEEVLDE